MFELPLVNPLKSTIVKFRSWKARQRSYKSRPRYYADSSKKPGFTMVNNK